MKRLTAKSALEKSVAIAIARTLGHSRLRAIRNPSASASAASPHARCNASEIRRGAQDRNTCRSVRPEW